MNETQIERIAAAINALRPDWPAKSLTTFIANRLGDRAARDVAVALTWVACDPETQAPTRVLEAGPWWRATTPDGGQSPARAPRSGTDEECPSHLGKWAHNCPLCRADQLAGDDPLPTRRELAQQRAAEQREREKRRDPNSPVARLRGEHRAATGALCRHRVRPTHCKDCRDMAGSSEGMPSAPEQGDGKVLTPGEGSEAATGTREPQTWVCDGCMQTVTVGQVADMADGEHVLCRTCRDGEPPATSDQHRIIHDLLGQVGLTEPQDQREYVHATVGRPVASKSDLTRNEAQTLISKLRELVELEKQ